MTRVGLVNLRRVGCVAGLAAVGLTCPGLLRLETLAKVRVVTSLVAPSRTSTPAVALGRPAPPHHPSRRRRAAARPARPLPKRALASMQTPARSCCWSLQTPTSNLRCAACKLPPAAACWPFVARARTCCRASSAPSLREPARSSTPACVENSRNRPTSSLKCGGERATGTKVHTHTARAHDKAAAAAARRAAAHHTGLVGAAAAGERGAAASRSGTRGEQRRAASTAAPEPGAAARGGGGRARCSAPHRSRRRSSGGRARRCF